MSYGRFFKSLDRGEVGRWIDREERLLPVSRIEQVAEFAVEVVGEHELDVGGPPVTSRFLSLHYLVFCWIYSLAFRCFLLSSHNSSLPSAARRSHTMVRGYWGLSGNLVGLEAGRTIHRVRRKKVLTLEDVETNSPTRSAKEKECDWSHQRFMDTIRSRLLLSYATTCLRLATCTPVANSAGASKNAFRTSDPGFCQEGTPFHYKVLSLLPSGKTSPIRTRSGTVPQHRLSDETTYSLAQCRPKSHCR